MTRRAYFSLVLTLAAAIVFSAAAYATGAPAVRYESASPGSSVKVEGTSNIHDWDGTTDQIEGWIELPGRWVDEDGGLRLEPAFDDDAAAPRIEVRIPVTSLEGNRRGLASNMHDALEADEHPHVSFTLTDLEQATAQDPSGGAWRVRGQLTVAGMTRSIDLRLAMRPQGDDRLRINVERALKMTDFGIDPPRAMMGMARAADDVDVSITWVVRRTTPQPTQAQLDAPAEQRAAMGEFIEAYDAARGALAAGERAQAQEALAAADAIVETLAALEASNAESDQLNQWQERVGRLRSALEGFANADSLSGARATFAVLSHALSTSLEIVAYEGDGYVAEYDHPQARGIAGGLWLEHRTDEAAEPQSPYTDTPPAGSTPRVRAIYPATPTTDD